MTRSPYGIGLSIPETMQCAIDECGLFRILLAAAVGGAARLFRKKGWFYRVAGSKAAAIDGPCPYTLPPYNRYVVLGPDRPDEAAQAVSEQMGGILTLVVDCNDLGCEILGCSHRKADRQKYICLLRQNPLGQGDECTPVGVLRPIRENKALE